LASGRRFSVRRRINFVSEEEGGSAARIWQGGKAEKEGSHRFQSKDTAEDQDSSQDRRQIPSRQGGKGRGSGGKEVIPPVAKKLI
jgi:hypothetical protein